MARTPRLDRLIVSVALVLGQLVLQAGAEARAEMFRRIPTQFIAALGEPGASSGTGAEAWGLWRVDPGPRGVRLGNFGSLQSASGVAPAKWQFNEKDWWLEENGLIMESPEYSLPPGKYVVTGGREAVSVLTIHPVDANGQHRWELANGATLHDVTHLKCRSARYRPASSGSTCSPENVNRNGWPVAPGAAMPPVEGCSKVDHAVLFVIGVAEGE